MRSITSSKCVPSGVKLFDPVHTTRAEESPPTLPEAMMFLKWL